MARVCSRCGEPIADHEGPNGATPVEFIGPKGAKGGRMLPVKRTARGCPIVEISPGVWRPRRLAEAETPPDDAA
jgi:hypothetical protein